LPVTRELGSAAGIGGVTDATGATSGAATAAAGAAGANGFIAAAPSGFNFEYIQTKFKNYIYLFIFCY
jgi:hypothetical protein